MVKYLLSLCIFTSVFLIDILVPFGVASGVLYTFAVLSALLYQPLMAIIWLASIASGLIVLEFFLFPQEGDEWIQVGDRVLSLLTVWAVAGALWWSKQLRESRDRLLHAQHRAETENRAKSAFLSSMSHELRTPLNAILGFAQMLNFHPSQPLTKEQKEYVGLIIRGGQHLLDLINEVLDLARIEAGKIELHMKSLPVRPIFHQCMDLVEVQARERGIEIILGGGCDCDTCIRADEKRFKQAMLNIMTNAIKYNHRGGKVFIDCHVMRNEIAHFSITDTGNGIPESKLGQLFEPFNRIGAEDDEIEGTGIGLTITKQIVEAMGGRIGVKSKVGKGSTFWMEFAQSSKELAAQDEEDTPIVAADTDGVASGSVLYIEDNSANLRLMELIISKVDGISLVSARNGKDGVRVAKDALPNLIIVDINLPDCDGYEVLRELRLVGSLDGTPVIALSARATPADVEKGIAAGFARYLIKPMRVSEIAGLIVEILRKKPDVKKPELEQSLAVQDIS